MIKIFLGEPEDIEKQVNEFMKEHNTDLPVRTDILNNKFVATVFYNKLSDNILPKKNVFENSENKRVGAVWFKNNIYSGNLNGKRFVFNEKDWESLDSYDSKIGKIRQIPLKSGGIAKILPNKYKVKDKHPDYVILKEEESK